MPALLLFGLIAVPLCGAALVAVLPRGARWGSRTVLWAVAASELLLAATALLSFFELPAALVEVFAADGGAGATHAPQVLATSHAWTPGLGLELRVGVDNLSVYPLIAASLLFLIAASASAACGRGRSLGLLVAFASVQGAFLATDLLLFSLFAQTAVFGLFFAVCLTPVDGDLEASGSSNERRRLALKFLLPNYAATLALQAAALAVRSAAQQQTGSHYLTPAQLHGLVLPADTQTWIAVAFGLFLAVLLPIPPFHRWFVELCATATRNPKEVLLVVGVWPLIGLYGLLRFALPLCPEPVEQFGAEWGGAVAALTALYGAALALGERHSSRRRIAGACLSCNGLILLGVASLSSEGVHGSFLYALNHGLVRTLVCALVLSLSAPVAARAGNGRALLWWVVLLSFVGLPVASPFSGALLCVTGGFAAFPGFTAATLAGLLVSGYSLMSAGRREDSVGEGDAHDAGTSRMVACVLALTLCLGLQPGPIAAVTTPAVEGVTAWLPTSGYRVVKAASIDGMSVPDASVPAAADTAESVDGSGDVTHDDEEGNGDD